MKTRPILFNAEMVRAILEGRKTQTRRVVKPRPLDGFALWHGAHDGCQFWTDNPRQGIKGNTFYRRCPYGVPGDRLWVRETWATHGNYDHIKPSELGEHPHSGIVYRATEQHGDAYFKWRPSIFMPRWASRLTLDLLDVRVEQVQDISEADAVAEGLLPVGSFALGTDLDMPATVRFSRLWDSINAKRGLAWESNPWVWVVKFEVCNEIN